MRSLGLAGNYAPEESCHQGGSCVWHRACGWTLSPEAPPAQQELSYHWLVHEHGVHSGWRLSALHIPCRLAVSSFLKEDLLCVATCNLASFNFSFFNFLQSCITKARYSLLYISSSDSWLQIFDSNLSLLRRKEEFITHDIKPWRGQILLRPGTLLSSCPRFLPEAGKHGPTLAPVHFHQQRSGLAPFSLL